MKATPKDIFYLIVIALLAFAAFHYYHKPPEKKIIKVPEERGKFEPQKPVYITDTLKVYVTKWRTKTDTIEVKTPNPVNQELAFKYQNTKDSLERYKLFLHSIQIRPFKNTFEDDKLRLSVAGEVQGELLKINVEDYLIKGREIEVENKRFGVGVYAGYGLGTNFTLTPQVGIGVSYNLFKF